MTIADLVIEKLRHLPAGKQQEVLSYVESLSNEKRTNENLLSLEGIWADLGFNITAEDIAEARREMWGNFPRDIS
ncbi:MAG TPA: hypothetical protein VHA33_17960 [Candidatus Angelobacter sp.]|jgi:hypothetical protein|nr:hypothetical protein [Candidatus Angelobacter sp.]